MSGEHGEPWSSAKGKLTQDELFRARACVNSFDGYPNPFAAVELMEDVVRVRRNLRVLDNTLALRGLLDAIDRFAEHYDAKMGKA